MNQLQNILDCLNSAVAADPHAMHALLSNIVPTNEAMVDHPHMVVNTRVTPYVTLGMLGVINGLMTAAGIPRVAAKYSDVADADGQHAFEGFVRAAVQPEPKNVHVLLGRFRMVRGIAEVTDKEIVVAESIADAEDVYRLRHSMKVHPMALAYLNPDNILQVLAGTSEHITEEDKASMRAAAAAISNAASRPQVALMRVLVGVLEHAYGKHSAVRKEAVMAPSLLDAEEKYRVKHNLREQPVALAHLDASGVVVCLPGAEAYVTMSDDMLLRSGDPDIVADWLKVSVNKPTPEAAP